MLPMNSDGKMADGMHEVTRFYKKGKIIDPYLLSIIQFDLPI